MVPPEIALLVVKKNKKKTLQGEKRLSVLEIKL